MEPNDGNALKRSLNSSGTTGRNTFTKLEPSEQNGQNQNETPKSVILFYSAKRTCQDYNGPWAP